MSAQLMPVGHDFYFSLTDKRGHSDIRHVRLWGPGEGYLDANRATFLKDGFIVAPATEAEFRDQRRRKAA